MKLWPLLFCALMGLSADAQMGLSPQSVQLQQLIRSSEQQLKILKDLLANGRRDTDAIDKATRTLEKLSEGLDQSIEKYQGTDVYQQALLRLESENLQKTLDARHPSEEARREERETFASIQKQGIQADLAELAEQKKLENGLRSAPPGFLPKLQTQAQIGQWRTSTRISAQLTELNVAVQSLRADLSGSSISRRPRGLALLLRGSELQNQKQLEAERGPK